MKDREFTEPSTWEDDGIEQLNPYDEPARCGLTIVQVIDEPNLSYAFNMVVLWRDTESGKLYWAADSGCSCPSPFENIRRLSDLQLYALTPREYYDACKARDQSCSPYAPSAREALTMRR